MDIKDSRIRTALAAAFLLGTASLLFATEVPVPEPGAMYTEAVFPLRFEGLTREEVRPPQDWTYRQNAVAVAPDRTVTERSTQRDLLMAPGEAVKTVHVNQSVAVVTAGRAFSSPAKIHNIRTSPLRFGEEVAVVGHAADGSKLVFPGTMGVFGVELDEDHLTGRLKVTGGEEYKLAAKMAAIIDSDDTWMVPKINGLGALLDYEMVGTLSGAGVFNADRELVGIVSAVKIIRQPFIFEGRSYEDRNVEVPTAVTLRLFYAHQIQELLGAS